MASNHGEKKRQNDAAVQGTNDSSIVSKCSMASLGYFRDDFLQHFVGKRARRAPLINKGYYIRARAIDDVLQAFLRHFCMCKNQIVSLGAGFDSTYFRLQSAGKVTKTVFYEVDYPQLVNRKARLIKSKDQLRDALRDPVFHDLPDSSFGLCVSSERYRLLGVDLKHIEVLHATLQKSGLEFTSPTLLLSECVITYIDTPSSNALISWAAETFRNGVFVSYEQVLPHDPFGIIMQQHFQKLSSPLNAIQTYPSMQKHCSRYIDQGWEASRAVNMHQYYSHILSEAERQGAESIELFDEYEEWHLKCIHYVVVAAFNGICADTRKELFIDLPLAEDRGTEPPTRTLRPILVHADLYCKPSLRRFSHASAAMSGRRRFLVTGGFGDSAGNHVRIDHVQVLDLMQKTVLELVSSPGTEKLGPRLHHTITPLSSDRFLIFGGRTSPSKPCVETLILRLGPTEGGAARSKEYLLNRMCDAESPLARPPARWRHTATPLGVGGREAVLVVGGRGVEGPPMGDTWLLDVEQCSWEKLEFEGPAWQARHSHSASHWEGSLVVVACGMGADSTPLDSVVTLDLTQRTCRAMRVQPPLVPRYSHTAHIVRDQLVLVGGVSPTCSNPPSLTVINLTTGCWRDIGIEMTSPQHPLMLHNHTSHWLEEAEEEEGTGESILIVGGGGNCFSFGTHLNQTPVIVGQVLGSESSCR